MKHNSDKPMIAPMAARLDANPMLIAGQSLNA
jgi:hypothetical protein